MENFKFEELKDIFELIISFTDNKTFCTLFRVSKRFKEICDKLKDKKVVLIHTTLSLSPLPSSLSSSTSLCSLCYLSPEIKILCLSNGEPFDSLNVTRSYKNERMRDEWIDSKLNRVLEITYNEKKIDCGFYYLKNKKDKDRYEFDFINSKIILINNSQKYEYAKKEYLDKFIQNYKY